MSESTEATAPKAKKSVALSGIAAGNTALCTVGRSGNDLHYRGYDILDIAESCEFEEVAYLLVHGKLPNRAELAGAAVAAEAGRVAEGSEERRVQVELGEAPVADVPHREGQEAAAADVADVGDEREPVAGQAAARHRRQPRRHALRPPLAAVAGALHLDAAEVGGADLLDRERRVPLEPVEPAQDPLLLGRRQLLVGEQAAPAGRDEEEELPAGRAELADERVLPLEQVRVRPHHGRVDLEGDARGAEVRQALERGGVEAGGGGEAIAALRVREVEAERDPLHPGRGDLAAELWREQPADVDRQGQLEAELGADRGELERVRPAERLAPGQDQHRPGERLGEIGHERAPLVERELGRVALVLCGRAAVLAGERAGARQLPGDDEGGPAAHPTVRTPFIPARSWPATEQKKT